MTTCGSAFRTVFVSYLFSLTAFVHSETADKALDGSDAKRSSNTPSHQTSKISSTAADVVTENLYFFTVNGNPTGKTFLVLQDDLERLYMSEADLTEIGVKLQKKDALEHSGSTYYPLTALGKTTFLLNRSEQTATLDIDPHYLSHRRFSIEQAPRANVTPSAPALIANYNLLATHQDQHQTVSGLFEAGLVKSSSVGISSFYLSPKERSLPNSYRPGRMVRLDTFWRYDNINGLTTYQLGDNFQRIGSWGKSLRYGGFSFGKSYSLQPGLITFPIEAVTGIAALPSIADVYVNQQLSGSQQIQPGPFTINDIPVISGAGEVNIVVRDLLGRENLIVKNFYASQKLLKNGFSDYSLDLGFVRNDYGIASADYGSATTSVLYRHGLSDAVTMEGRFYHVGKDAAVGTSIDWLAQAGGSNFPVQGLARARIVTSRTTKNLVGVEPGRDTGLQLGLGFERDTSLRQAKWPVTIAIDTSISDRNFRLPGARPGELQSARQVIASGGFNTGKVSFSLAYFGQRYRDAPPLQSFSIGCSAPITGLASFTSFLTAPIGNHSGQRSTSLYLGILLPLGENSRIGTLSLDRNTNEDGRAVVGATFQNNFLTGPGIAYRGTARSDGGFQAGLLWNTEKAALTTELGRVANGAVATRVGIKGAFGMVPGHTFASRSLDGSFAVIRIGDYQGVKVYRENHLVTLTNNKGYAVIPSLIPHSVNRLSIDVGDVPIDANIRNTRLEVIPGYRGAVTAEFPVSSAKSFTFRLVDQNGTELPAGSKITGNGDTLIVGYEGLVYVTSGQSNQRMQMQFESYANGRACRFAVDPANHSDLIPDLGVIQCKPLP